MIILDADEEQIAQSRAVMESNSDSGRKVRSAGTLTLTNKFGAKYRCHPCDVQFSKITTYDHHKRYVRLSPAIKKILILGGGFSGINVLKFRICLKKRRCANQPCKRR